MSQHAPSTPWKLTVWGARGSIATSAADVRAYGGQTTCIVLELPDAFIIVDAGSGIVEFGKEFGKDRRDTLLLFTHVHWDHIVGFPFFQPIYESSWKLDVRGVPRAGKSVLDAVYDVNCPPTFPVNLRDGIRASLTTQDLPEEGTLNYHGVQIRWMEGAHPGGCSMFEFTLGGTRVVFTGDLEIPQMDRAKLLDFIRGADVLLCDSQYRDEDYCHYTNWGHSTNIQAAKLAKEAGVERLILTHHDPRHSDDVIDSMVEQARRIFPVTDGARNRMVIAQG